MAIKTITHDILSVEDVGDNKHKVTLWDMGGNKVWFSEDLTYQQATMQRTMMAITLNDWLQNG